MDREYSPLAIANYFVQRFGAADGIEHMKLQKLVYCAHGWWLTQTNAQALVTEKPEVWRFGPVFPSLYQALKIFGREPIRAPQSRSPFEVPETISNDDKHIMSLLDWVWNRYGHRSSFYLSDMTHKPGTPWHRVASEHNFSVPMGMDIPNEYIAEEFRQIYEAEFGKQEA